jgi:ribosomal protein L32
MDAADLARLEQWASGHRERPVAAVPPQGLLTTTSHEALDAAALKMEAGLRVCPRCGKPVHMSATVCRDCGAPVPKR